MQRKYLLIYLIIFAVLVLIGGYFILTKDNSNIPTSQNLTNMNDQKNSNSTSQMPLNNPPLNSTSSTDKLVTNSSESGAIIKKTYTHFPGVLPVSQLNNRKAVITTDKGIIEFEIYPDSPMAASNFITLSQDGFYNDLIFHRVVPGFVIQGGDPQGTGTGGPGYTFNDEPVTKSYFKGIVAMANAGPNTNGSQFFIMLEDNPSLPPNYTIFGKVIAGQDVVSQIKVGDVMKSVTIVNLK